MGTETKHNAVLQRNPTCNFGTSMMLSSFCCCSKLVFFGSEYTTGLCSTVLLSTIVSVRQSLLKALASISLGRVASVWSPSLCCGAHPSLFSMGPPSDTLYMFFCAV